MVELIVVITIIITLATLTALYFPRYQDKEMVARGADLLQGWLLNAKQRAKRDGLPTGLLLVVATDPNLNYTMDFTDPAFPTGKKVPRPFVNEVHYIQQPDDFAQGIYTGPQVTATGTNTKMATFAGVNLKTLGGIKIQTGDYLEIFGSGVLRRIGDPNRPAPIPPDYPVLDPPAPGLPGTLLELDPVATDLPALPSPPTVLNPDTTNTQNQRTNYRIIAQPRELAGEQKLFLPENVGIDLNPNNPGNPSIDPSSGVARPMSRNLPTRTAVVNGVTVSFIEILFSPTGAVVGRGTTSGKIILWVRDLRNPNSPPISTPATAAVPAHLLNGGATLLTIDPRTGFIASHTATTGTPGNDPYQFTRDGRSSGL